MRGCTPGCSRTGDKRLIVLDTGAILAGTPQFIASKSYTTESVISEVKDPHSTAIVERLMSSGRLEVLQAPSEYRDAAKRAARSTGTLLKLSDTDLDVLALALYLRDAGCDPIVMTDDYALQYTLRKLGIKFKGVKYKGIKR